MYPPTLPFFYSNPQPVLIFSYLHVHQSIHLSLIRANKRICTGGSVSDIRKGGFGSILKI